MLEEGIVNRRIIGLDLGKASVGWAVVETDADNRPIGIVAAGVRTFPAAEISKTAESPNKPRREARSDRRRLRRRAFRLIRLRRLFVDRGFLDAATYLHDGEPDTDGAFATLHKEVADTGVTPWELRVRALDHRLEPEEWAVVLTHLAVRRGFKSNSKRELKRDKETHKVNEALEANERLWNQGGWRTIGEMVGCTEKFTLHKRNKQGDYSHTIKRDRIEKEIETLFERQRALGNRFASEEIMRDYIEIWGSQRSYDQGNVETMIGRCTFEPEELRAPRNGWTSEYCMLLQKVNNLRFQDRDYALTDLSDEERQGLIEKAYAVERVTYKTIRSLLNLDESCKFPWLKYGKKDTKGVIKDPETSLFVALTGWHSLRKAIEACGEEHWKAMQGDTDLLDTIAEALTYHKEDRGVKGYLEKRGYHLSDEIKEAILEVDFTKVGNLSFKALKKIIPYLQEGTTYDKACEAAGYDFRMGSTTHNARAITLPPIPPDEIRNPIVMRGLTQARKVLNAVIKEYGQPHAIHIELLRDIANSAKKRDEIEKGQREYADNKQQAIEHFKEIAGREPKGRDLAKFRLAEEQDYECPYSGHRIDPKRLVNDETYVQIDHILPYSRSLDDSRNNQVLCLTDENQRKGNHTPYEYLGGAEHSQRWHEFTVRIASYKDAKRRRLQRSSFDRAEAEEHRQRQVERPESKYIAKFFKNWAERHLAFAPSEIGNRVQTRNGQLTAFLRTRWGLSKVRSEGDNHHALDAIVVACATQAMVQRISEYSQGEELWLRDAGDREAYDSVDSHTGAIKQTFQKHEEHRWLFPLPWEGFRRDVVTCLDTIFVSRPPRLRVPGEAHGATLHSIKRASGGATRKRIPLTSLTTKNVEQLVDKDGRNRPLYEALKERLEQPTGDGGKRGKPFAEPFYHPDPPTKGQIVVRRVAIEEPGRSGIPIRGGLAANSQMLRTDVFEKAGKFYLVPIYVHHRLTEGLPDRAIKAGKPEEEWRQIDDSFRFCFSLHIDDLVEIQRRGKDAFCGYFKGTDRVNATIAVDAHDRSWPKPEGSIGVQKLLVFRKQMVDLLGRRCTIRSEKRLGLAKPAYKQTRGPAGRP